MSRALPKIVSIGIAALFVVGIIPTTVVGTHEDVKGVGKHLFKFSIIGRPNTYTGSGDTSNGNVVFIDLKSENQGKSNGQSFVCENGSFYEEEPANQEPFYTLLDNKEKIYFSASADGQFRITDRDATADNIARIEVPADVGEMHVAVRILGKPGGCADFDGIAESTCIDDSGATVQCFWWTGTIHANRRTGTPEKVEVTQIFDVTGDFNGDGVITDGSGGTMDETDLSVFDEIFASYFWEVTNDGLKNMQVIFYSAA